jgi:hypothetical protein
MSNTRAPRSVVIAVTLLIGAVITTGLFVHSSIQSQQSVAIAERERLAVAEDDAYERVDAVIERSGVTLPKPPDVEAVLSYPATTDKPSSSTVATTTTIPQLSLDRAAFEPNQQMGLVSIPTIGVTLNLNRADEVDHGATALEGGSAAWWSSSSTYVDSGLPTNDLSLPGESGNVVIGAHRGGYARTGPFANIHLLAEGDLVQVTTFDTNPDGRAIPETQLTFTYRVVDPCREVDGLPEPDCYLPVETLMTKFANHQSQTETLFLFSCDNGKRIFVTAELVG